MYRDINITTQASHCETPQEKFSPQNHTAENDYACGTGGGKDDGGDCDN